MLPKKMKLTGKDVRFLLRKRGLVYGKGMVFVVHPQYADRPYHQRSLQVSVKIAKSSVKRNLIKRLFFEQLARDLPVDQKLCGGYFKIFAYFHKSALEELTKMLANTPKNTINDDISTYIHEHFISFPPLLCRYLDSSKKSDTPSRKKPHVSKQPRRKS